jgi:hypothetical protein
MPWHERPPRYGRRCKARSALARRGDVTLGYFAEGAAVRRGLVFRGLVADIYHAPVDRGFELSGNRVQLRILMGTSGSKQRHTHRQHRCRSHYLILPGGMTVGQRPPPVWSQRPVLPKCIRSPGGGNRNDLEPFGLHQRERSRRASVENTPLKEVSTAYFSSGGRLLDPPAPVLSPPPLVVGFAYQVRPSRLSSNLVFHRPPTSRRPGLFLAWRRSPRATHKLQSPA